ncbi:Protein-lysine 6-oxidase OS=Streptomyces glaucescens OX=1907 GN=SGLAU_17805 PE=4 SV=1 [Streptomyces glaucescens]
MTSQKRTTRLKRGALAAGAALTVVVAGAGAAPGAGDGKASTAGKPKLKLIAASNSVTLDRWEGEPGV